MCLTAGVEFLRRETIGGAVLLAATISALIWANVGTSYEPFWATDLTLGSGRFSITEDLRHWVNDGLMVFFFFIVALEVKRELVVGELSDRRAASVPVLGAFGGVALPAGIFLIITGVFGGSGDTSGWAIPAATDIAFAVGVLAMLESGVHATIAGVTIGLLTPARPINDRSVIEVLEHNLHPFTAGMVVPLFALANAGIAFNSEMLSDAAGNPIAWGIIAGLTIGKLAGIGGTIMLVTPLGIGTIPSTIRSAHIWGMAAIAGIGFTVSLFITQLAYQDPTVIDAAILGVFAGSIISASIGAHILISTGRAPRNPAG